MDLAQGWLVAAITWLAVISPGADFAIVSRNSSLHGRSAGLASSVGIASGCFVHVTYAIIGLAVISEFFPDFFRYVQLIGAAYLAYLGLSMILSKAGGQTDVGSENHSPRPVWHFYGMGLLTNSLNPKTSLFVVSLYSQVIGPETHLAEKLFWGCFISLSHFIWFGCVTLFMSAPSIRKQVIKHQNLFNAIIGAILIVLGALLLFNDNLGV